MLTDRKKIDTDRAQQIWTEYQQQHDLSSERGKVAAIDPDSGRVWIGDSGIDVADRMHADGFDVPVYLVRIGFDYFVRKGQANQHRREIRGRRRF